MMRRLRSALRTVAPLHLTLGFALIGGCAGGSKPAEVTPDAGGIEESGGSTPPASTGGAGGSRMGQEGDGGKGGTPVSGGSPDALGPTGPADGGMAASDAQPESPPAGVGKDGGNSEAGGGGGPSLCAGGLLLCEGFEQGIDPAVWTKKESGGGTVTVDSEHAFRGQKALHVHVAGGKGPAYVAETKSFPVPNNVFYARMYFWFGDPIERGDHFNLAEAKGTGNGASIRFGGQYRALGVGTDGGASGDWTDKDSAPIPTNKWLCYEVLFKGDTSEFQVWVDGEERPKLHSGSNRHGAFKMPMFTSFAAGWWDYNGAEPQDLWIDEIAVDSKPIGCMK